MEYEKFQPAPSLQPVVECYFSWKGVAEKELDVQSPPSGLGALVVNYSDPYQSYQNGSAPTFVPAAFVCGLFTSNYHLVLKGNVGMVGIVFRPSAIHNIFGLRMSTLVNSRVPLHLLPGFGADNLMSTINEAQDEDRIKILEDFLLSRIRKATSSLSIIDETISHIDNCNGCTTVEAVAAHFKISRRYLEKRFLEKVGISPKLYARIKRFGALSNKIAHSEKIDWQEIVLSYGFHDQSHLIKEFIEFNQMNPSQYHLLHTELVRFVKR